MFEYLQGRTFHNLSGKPRPVFDRFHSKKRFFLSLNTIHYVSICAYCLLSFHWAALGLSPSSLLSHQVFRHIDKVILSLLFSGLNSPQLSQPPLSCQMLQALNCFCGHLLDLLHYISVCFVLRSPELDPELQIGLTRAE